MIDLGAPAPSRGPVAQLGARVNGIHEVTGSIPVWSTTFFRKPLQLTATPGVMASDRSPGRPAA